MEAPKSLKQKDGEPIMSYINKGMQATFDLSRLYVPRELFYCCMKLVKVYTDVSARVSLKS